MYPYRFRLSMRIFSPDLDPEEIIKTLKLNAKWVRKVGEPRVTPNGLPLEGKYKRTSCTFDFDPKKSEDLPNLISRLCTELSKHRNFFKEIRLKGGVIEFFVGIFLQESNSGEVFRADLLTKLGELGIDLSLDIYERD